MAHHLLQLSERQVVLVVRAAADHGWLPAALVDEELRLAQIALMAGLAVQLDERQLDLRVAAGAGAAPGAEGGRDVVREARRDVQQG